MPKTKIFTTKLQLVNVVLEELGEKIIPSITANSLIEINLNSSIQRALHSYNWSFSNKTCDCEPLDIVVPRFKSVWKIPNSAGDYVDVVEVYLREDLLQRCPDIHWCQLPDNNIGTNFNKNNILNPETAVKVVLTIEPDIQYWGPYFCDLIRNDFKGYMAGSIDAKRDVAEQCYRLRKDLLKNAIEEDYSRSNKEYEFTNNEHELMNDEE